jgi:hypothetical protein
VIFLALAKLTIFNASVNEILFAASELIEEELQIVGGGICVSA